VAPSTLASVPTMPPATAFLVAPFSAAAAAAGSTTGSVARSDREEIASDGEALATRQKMAKTEDRRMIVIAIGMTEQKMKVVGSKCARRST